MKELGKEALVRAITGLVFTITVIGLTISIFFNLVIIYASVYAYLHVTADTTQATHQLINPSKK
jgi:uncharacterized membrane protein